MPVETSLQIAPNLAAVLLMLLGGAALLFPKTMAAFVGLGPIAPVGISEIRSTLGSFFLGLGAACLWLQSYRCLYRPRGGFFSGCGRAVDIEHR